MDLNLLPKEKAASKDVVKTVDLLKKVSFASAGVFLLVSAVLGVFYFLSLNSLISTRANHEELAARARSMQATEASLIFLKDRLQKTQIVLAARQNEETFAKQAELLSQASSEVTFKESELGSSNSTLELTTPDSKSLADYMSNIVANSSFRSLVLKELSFGLSAGYSLLFEVF